jgi:hypothetical protein
MMGRDHLGQLDLGERVLLNQSWRNRVRGCDLSQCRVQWQTLWTLVRLPLPCEAHHLLAVLTSFSGRNARHVVTVFNFTLHLLQSSLCLYLIYSHCKELNMYQKQDIRVSCNKRFWYILYWMTVSFWGLEGIFLKLPFFFPIYIWELLSFFHNVCR